MRRRGRAHRPLRLFLLKVAMTTTPSPWNTPECSFNINFLSECVIVSGQMQFYAPAASGTDTEISEGLWALSPLPEERPKDSASFIAGAKLRLSGSSWMSETDSPQLKIIDFISQSQMWIFVLLKNTHATWYTDFGSQWEELSVELLRGQQSWQEEGRMQEGRRRGGDHLTSYWSGSGQSPGRRWRGWK